MQDKAMRGMGEHLMPLCLSRQFYRLWARFSVPPFETRPDADVAAETCQATSQQGDGRWLRYELQFHHWFRGQYWITFLYSVHSSSPQAMSPPK